MFIRCNNKVVESSQLILNSRYEDLLSHYKFNVEEALKKANIPEDCFKKLHPSMSELNNNTTTLWRLSGRRLVIHSLQLKLQLKIQLNLSPHQFLRHKTAVTEIFSSQV